MGGYSRLQVKALAFLAIAFLLGSAIRFLQRRVPLPAVDQATSTHFRAVAESLNAPVVADSLRANVAGGKQVALASTVPARIHINTASAEELQTLPGIGAIIAGRIIKYRQEHGLFKAVNELAKVKGVGMGTLKRLSGKIAL